jgi:hypothetical protein
VTEKVPDVDAEPVAVSFVAETKVVLSVAPANKTWAPLTKLLPFIVSVNAPVANDCGFTLPRVGDAFHSVSVAVAVALESAALTALIVTLPAAGIALGAL